MHTPNCYTRQNYDKSTDEEKFEESKLFMAYSDSYVFNDVWYFDSGYLDHMSCLKSLFKDLGYKSDLRQ